MNPNIGDKVTLPQGYSLAEDNVGRLDYTDIIRSINAVYNSTVEYGIYKFKTASQFEVIVAGISCFVAYVLMYVIFQFLSMAKVQDKSGSDDDSIGEEDDLPPPRDFTVDQLHEFNGEIESSIYVALKGEVFDVSCAADFYGSGNSYNCFAGRDASRAMAKFSFDDADLNSLKIDDLSPYEREVLNDWVTKFKHFREYPIVGRVSEAPKGLCLTLTDMASYDGSMPVPIGRVHSPIYVSLNGNIFDVSYGGRELYCKGAPYACFAGKDVSKALAKMTKNDEDINNLDLSDLTETQKKTLCDWEEKYKSRKYPIVGRLQA